MDMEEENGRGLADLTEEQLMNLEASNKDDGRKFEDEYDDEFEQEIVDVDQADGDDNSDDFESVEEEINEVKKKVLVQKEKKKEIEALPFIGNEKQLQKDEYLDYDNSAYTMLHRANTEWPCLSFDWLRSDPSKEFNLSKPSIQKEIEYPLDLYSVAGSQASLPSKNKIYVMRFANLYKTKHDDDPDFEDEKVAH